MSATAFSFAPPRRVPRQAVRRLLRFVAAALLIGACTWVGFSVGRERATAALRMDSGHRLELFASAVHGMLQRLEHEPATIQLSQDVQALLRHPKDAAKVEAAHQYLQHLNAYLGSLAVFVLDDRGIVLASSDPGAADDSRVGQDLSFRPYYLDALSGRVGRHFAIGIGGNQPGYFVSHPIHDGARVVGVATIKISLDSIDGAWKMLGVPALLADANQVAILSSQPEWRYTSLIDLPVERRVDLQLNRLYSDLRPARFPLDISLPAPDEETGAPDGSTPYSLSQAPGSIQGDTLILGRAIDGMDWRLLTFSSLRGVYSQARLYAAMSALAAGFVVLGLSYLAQRRRIRRQGAASQVLLERANQQLERKVEARTRDLNDINLRLRSEVIERQQAEQTLRATQDELVQTAKLAVLGQMATGITHELTQPLGAIRTLSGNTIEFLRRGELAIPASNLEVISRLADQMGKIIQPLKSFARKSRSTPELSDVGRAVANALFLFDSRLRTGGIVVSNDCPPGRTTAWCDPNRLEQVLVNLIGNAADAMENSPVKRLSIRTTESTGATGQAEIRIEVADTGTGFAADAFAQIFEPFFTTKSSGAGLGLGLTISRDIARECRGDIEAAPGADGGARFILRLPASAPPSFS
jgi:two-component system C4-dicarboxylate transport sensor histidine kinase DctB